MTHYPLYLDAIEDETFDITKLDEYRGWYFSIDRPHRERMLAAFEAAGVTIVISGHIHCYRSEVARGIRFTKAPATAMVQLADRLGTPPTLGFLRYDVTDAGITETLIPLKRVSTRTDGYGPGGHPKPQVRDYSLAWEK